MITLNLSYFLGHALCLNFFFPDFVLTLEDDNYGLKPPTFKTTTFPESSGHQLAYGTTLNRSYLFKILSNLRFSFPSFPCFLARSSLCDRRPLAKTLKLAVWAFSLIFLHDSKLFVIDIYQNMPISLISTPFDHFQLRLTLAVNPNLILEPCLMVLIQLTVKLERCRKLLVNYKEDERHHLLYCASGLVVRQPRSSEQRTVT